MAAVHLLPQLRVEPDERGPANLDQCRNRLAVPGGHICRVEQGAGDGGRVGGAQPYGRRHHGRT